MLRIKRRPGRRRPGDLTRQAMLNAFFSRWTRSALAGDLPAAPVAASRPGSSVDSLFQSLLRLIPGEADPWGAHKQEHHSSRKHLVRARAEFLRGLQDVQSEITEPLQTAIRRSRTLRDLWHLRTAVYTEVARSHSQYEAERRLAQLDRFFEPASGRRGH